ncbi:hypothetical protein GGR50DRAFT_566432 [Xylaria sp. CBS 124048]|nr:hypothetical protein GGR50DRAFT_566432 [Xylaria sp. CBS 124048]
MYHHTPNYHAGQYLNQGPNHNNYHDNSSSSAHPYDRCFTATPEYDGISITRDHFDYRRPRVHFQSPTRDIPSSTTEPSSTYPRPRRFTYTESPPSLQATLSRDSSHSETTYSSEGLSAQPSLPSWESNTSISSNSRRQPFTYQRPYYSRGTSPLIAPPLQRQTFHSPVPRTPRSEPRHRPVPIPRTRGPPLQPERASPPIFPPSYTEENMYRPPYRHGARSLLRDRPVLVSLEPAARDYVCDREDILENFPNTRDTLFGRTFQPQIARQYWRQPILDALHALFHGLERYRATGTPLYIFESARDWLLQDNAKSFEKCFCFFVGVCRAVDEENGLGCGEHLKRQINEFAVDLMVVHERGFFTGDNGRLMEFFGAYSRVFRSGVRGSVRTLRTLWGLVPGVVREGLVRDLGRALDSGSGRMRMRNGNDMLRTMRDLGMI